jgi:transcriptional regulator with XRE-family HTH domain
LPVSTKNLTVATYAATDASNSSPVRILRFDSAAGARPNRPGSTSIESLSGKLAAAEKGAERIAAARRRLAARLTPLVNLTLGDLRRRSFLSQKALADACNLEQSHISRYESGRIAPSLDIALLMANAIGVSLDEYGKARVITRDLAAQESHERS